MKGVKIYHWKSAYDNTEYSIVAREYEECIYKLAILMYLKDGYPLDIDRDISYDFSINRGYINDF